MAARIFYVNEYEWWIGDCTPKELLAAYLKETGVTREEALDDDDPEALPRELSDQELDRLIYVDEDGTSRTFREQLAIDGEDGMKPDSFANTEG